ncbi:hydrogenase maturation protease [Stygiolobus caldivivus]|uniref:Hydrogenase maturation protease n=1 Tax=Stygiolobus caldivivus TaxID=2824673 RepID=A0A8D5U4C4_9CREN|nr:hydrogenase maturation protease [Stygiolobus caldivivus]BCU68827.1 hypothetical protein KN1_01240 [Stygiolobus caldivivus]
MMRVGIIGVGNRIMGDDGLGSYLAQALYGNAEGAEVIDLGSAGINAIDYLKEFDVIVILDAVAVDQEGVFVSEEKINEGDTDQVTSTVLDMEISGSHGLGIQSTLFILKLMGYSPKIYIIGHKPYVLEPMSGISEKLREKVPQILDILQEVLKPYNVKINKDRTLKAFQEVLSSDRPF